VDAPAAPSYSAGEVWRPSGGARALPGRHHGGGEYPCSGESTRIVVVSAGPAGLLEAGWLCLLPMLPLEALDAVANIIIMIPRENLIKTPEVSYREKIVDFLALHTR
jgi:hypothetical protein